MSAIIRSFRNHGFRAERVFGITMLMSFAFIFYFLFLDGMSFSLENILGRVPFSVFFLSVLMFLIYGLIDVVCYVPLTISNGCTRRNMLLGQVFMHVVEVGQTLLVLAVFFALSPVKASIEAGDFLKMSAAAFIASSGVSLLAGMVVYRFGRIAYFIIIFALAGSGGLIGGLMGAFGGDTVAAMVPQILQKFGWVGLAVILYVICVAVFGLLSRKMEVKG